MIKVAIITLSDKGFKGERIDETGRIIKEILEKDCEFQIVHYKILPDEYEEISRELKRLADRGIADLILTNGGTGFSKRDITPEATLNVIEREIPGIPEYIRYRSSEITDRAILSRGRCGIRENSVILNLPGSPKGAKEGLEFVLDPLKHGIKVLKGESFECARKEEK